MCEECEAHFEALKSRLDAMGIAFEVEGTIVRGLDYYTKTVFEFKTGIQGTAGTVCGGGRYDGLIEELGGAPMPGIGFAMGIERVILALEESGSLPVLSSAPDIFIANIGEETSVFVSQLTDKLRKAELKCEQDLCGRSLKAQMKYADKCGAKYSIVIGTSEMEENKAVLKNMHTKAQTEVSLDNTEEIYKVVMEEK